MKVYDNKNILLQNKFKDNIDIISSSQVINKCYVKDFFFSYYSFITF